jgi:hypothetical protein
MTPRARQQGTRKRRPGLIPPAITAWRTCGLENADDFSQLADVNPVEFGNKGGQGRISLSPVGHGDDRSPLLPGGLGEQEGELTLTRD